MNIPFLFPRGKRKPLAWWSAKSGDKKKKEEGGKAICRESLLTWGGGKGKGERS